jgi:hypothetical protein
LGSLFASVERSGNGKRITLFPVNTYVPDWSLVVLMKERIYGRPSRKVFFMIVLTALVA